MANFFMIPTGRASGISSVSLGVLLAFEQAGHKVAYLKPVAQSMDLHLSIDVSTHFSRELFHLETPEPISISAAEKILSQGQEDDLIEQILAKYSELGHNHFDVAVIEGMRPDPARGYLVEKNQEIATSLNAEIIFIVGVMEMTAIQVADNLRLHYKKYNQGNTQIAGYILNKLPQYIDIKAFAQEVHQLLEKYNIPCIGLIPYAPEKSARRVFDVVDYLNANVLNGEKKLTANRIHEIVVGARSAICMADRFKPGALILVPGDRDDVLMASALVCARGVPLAGLVLTCQSRPNEALIKLISPVIKDNLPVLLTKYDTYETASLLSNQSPHVPYDDKARMKTIIDYMAENMRLESLMSSLAKPRHIYLTPAAFRYRLIEQAKRANRRIVLPEGDEPRTIQAAIICHQKNIASCVLLAKPEVVHEIAESHGLVIPEDMEIIDPKDIKHLYVDKLVEFRQHKGLTAIQAKEQLEDNVVVGTMMLALDEVDGLVSGAVHTTANTIKPALQVIKTAPNASLVSSAFFMLMPEQVLVYADCAVNPVPNAEQLADIAIQSADSAQAFGIEPRVAMISYSTGTSGTGADVEKVKEATKIAISKRPDLKIDGPLQYDAATVPSVGRQKAPDSQVAGQATVFIFPDLNTGNTTYKAVQRSANVLSIGPMLQGLNKAVNDLSRGALVDDIVYTIAITAIQANRL